MKNGIALLIMSLKPSIFIDLKDDKDVTEMLKNLSKKCNCLNLYVDGGLRKGIGNGVILLRFSYLIKRKCLFAKRRHFQNLTKNQLGKRGGPRKHPPTKCSSRWLTNQQQTSKSEAQALKKILAKERELSMSSDSAIYYEPGASKVSNLATTSSMQE
ncbi:hypothetical protein OROMI_008445 [Orobanche minor]